MRKIKIFLILISFVMTIASHAQSYDENRIILSNFAQRLYNSSPFEGCRIIDDYDNSYLLSVIVLDATKYKTKPAMNRMSQVKSQRNAGEFLNGTQSFSEFTVQTPKSEANGSSTDVSETIELIKANTTGYVRQMQLLTTFIDEDKMTVFIYFKEME